MEIKLTIFLCLNECQGNENYDVFWWFYKISLGQFKPISMRNCFRNFQKSQKTSKILCEDLREIQISSRNETFFVLNSAQD